MRERKKDKFKGEGKEQHRTATCLVLPAYKKIHMTKSCDVNNFDILTFISQYHSIHSIVLTKLLGTIF
jgi:hypothetical protein